jgi:hypothetical protein
VHELCPSRWPSLLPQALARLYKADGLLDASAAALRDALQLPAGVAVVRFCLLPHRL